MAAGEYQRCAVCGRTMLRGERLNEYLDEARTEVIVCALCKPRAEELGWVPVAMAGAAAEPAAPRRRLNLAGGLRERLARRAERPAEAPPGPAVAGPGPQAAPEPVAEPAPAPPVEPERAPEPEVASEPEPPRPPAPLEVFNDSSEARTVAGLIRSLGDPRVTLRDDTITVAWELSWYQWRVRGGRVDQVDKGNEISEIDGADRLWNARAAEDGTLSLD